MAARTMGVDAELQFWTLSDVTKSIIGSAHIGGSRALTLTNDCDAEL